MKFIQIDESSSLDSLYRRELLFWGLTGFFRFKEHSHAFISPTTYDLYTKQKRKQKTKYTRISNEGTELWIDSVSFKIRICDDNFQDFYACTQSMVQTRNGIDSTNKKSGSSNFFFILQPFKQ